MYKILEVLQEKKEKHFSPIAVLYLPLGDSLRESSGIFVFCWDIDQAETIWWQTREGKASEVPGGESVVDREVGSIWDTRRYTLLPRSVPERPALGQEVTARCLWGLDTKHGSLQLWRGCLWSVKGLRSARENTVRSAGSPFQEAVLGKWRKTIALDSHTGKQKRWWCSSGISMSL